jgi:hypothetical protein
MVRKLKEEWVKTTAIIEQVQQELGIYINKDYVSRHTRDIIPKIKELQEDTRGEIDELNHLIDDNKPNYDFDGENYIFEKSVTIEWMKAKKRFSIPMKLVDDIFHHYSIYWKNWSQQQCIDHFKVKPEVWNLLKSRLNLTKYCNVVSPESLELTANKWGEEALEEKIYHATYEAITDKYKDKVVNTYEKVFEKVAKDSMKKLANIDYFLDRIQTIVKTWEPLDVDIQIQPKQNNDVKVVAFGDMHVGRSTTYLMENVKAMLSNLIDSPESTIVLINLWDNFEGVMAWSQSMHDGMVYEMDLFWEEQFLKAVEIIEMMVNVLVQNWKTVRYHWVTHSNHDRITKSDENDPRHILAIAFNELLKRSLSGKVEEFHYYKDRVKSFQEAGMNFIATHWDLWFDKKRTEQILQMYGQYGIYNICLSWHMHQSALSEWTNYSRVIAPSLNGENEYSKGVVIAKSAPWYVEIKPNESNTADISFKRL